MQIAQLIHRKTVLRNSGSGKPVTAVGGLLAVRYLFALWPSGCTAWEGLKFGRIFDSKYRQPTLNMKPTITVYPVYEFLHRLAKSDILEWRERGAAQLMLYWETSCRHIGARMLHYLSCLSHGLT